MPAPERAPQPKTRSRPPFRVHLCVQFVFTLNTISQTTFLQNSGRFYMQSLPAHPQSLWEHSPPNVTGTCHSTRNPDITGIRGPLGCGSLGLNARPMAPPSSPSSSGTAGSRFQDTFPLRQSSKDCCRASENTSLSLVTGVLFYHVWLADEIIHESRSRSTLYASLYLARAWEEQMLNACGLTTFLKKGITNKHGPVIWGNTGLSHFLAPFEFLQHEACNRVHVP